MTHLYTVVYRLTIIQLGVTLWLPITIIHFFEDGISEIEFQNRIASAKAKLPYIAELRSIPELTEHAKTIAILYRRYEKLEKLSEKEYLLNASFDDLQ